MAYEDRDLTWWQQLLVKIKLWQPPHRTLHHTLRDLPAPPPPPVTGAYGNRVVREPKKRLVPQNPRNTDNRPAG